MKIFIILLLLIGLAFTSNAQKVYFTQWQSERDFDIVFIDKEHDADWIISYTHNPSAAKNGIWYEVKHKSDADLLLRTVPAYKKDMRSVKKVFITDKKYKIKFDGG